MASRQAANAFFRERLPVELVEQLADAPPELVDGTFIDAQLLGSVADRLFRLRLRSGGSVFVYCLVEHKSAPEPRIALQLLRYQVRIWEQADREIVEPGSLPPIIPMVLYHGEAPWTVPRSFSALVEPLPAFGVRLLDFEVIAIDLGSIPDARLSGDPTLYAGFLELKYAKRKDGQRAMLRAILVALKRAPWLVEPGLTYILEAYDVIDRAFLLGEVREAMPEHEKELMSIAAREWQAEWRAEGKAEGKVEGRREVLLRVLGRRFGRVPESIRARVFAGGVPDLDAWLDRAIEAVTLDGVFGSTH